MGNTWRFHSSSRRDGVPVLRGARGDGIIDTAFIHSENDDKIPGRRFLQLRFQLAPSPSPKKTGTVHTSCEGS